MTIDKMIKVLSEMKEKVGGDSEVPVLRVDFGENDYIVPNYGITGDFEDQDGNEFKCALVGNVGGEEFSANGIPHYEWKPSDGNVIK